MLNKYCYINFRFYLNSRSYDVTGFNTFASWYERGIRSYVSIELV